MTAFVSASSSSATSDECRRPRLAGVDRVRGLAVLLMVADHALVAAGANAWRLNVTRLSLPLFCLVAGAVRPGEWPSRRRLATLVAVGLVATVPGAVVGIGGPDVVLLVAWALWLVPSREAALARPGLAWFLAVLCVLQPFTWPAGWAGYEPGAVWVLVALGVAIGPELVDRYGQRLPAGLGAVGRRPLLWYLGHLVVLAAAVSL